MSRPFERLALRAKPRRPSCPALLLFGLALCAACLTNLEATAEDEIRGSVRDADTGEAIANGWIFETERLRHAAADVPRVARARIARTDAEGEFSFAPQPAGLLHSILKRQSPKQYAFYHPSYGLHRTRSAPDSQRHRITPSLRDAHLRQRDADAFCRSDATDAMTEKMKELACPPSQAALFADGSPRAIGASDDLGRRDGPWTFYRKDGSVIARGQYRAGGAVGVWAFEPALARPTPP